MILSKSRGRPALALPPLKGQRALCSALAISCLTAVWSSSWVHAQPAGVPQAELSARAQSFSVADDPVPRKLLWGDTHLHTRYSFDAGMILNTLEPDDAYRFARGEVVVSSTGVPARLRQALDFLAVSDHAESLGIAPAIAEANPLALEDPDASRMRELIHEGKPIEAYKLFAQLRMKGKYVLHREDLSMDMWRRITASADRYYQPGVFTTLIGYEYTSALNMNNLHRVVLFADSSEKANKVRPFSMAESPNPEDLWAWMADYEEVVGGRVLAIPHNGNLSNGLMFADKTFGGAPLTAEWARQRARWEPLYEVTQIKGDGESHPLLSPDDEFADFWTWDRGNFGMQAKDPSMLPGEYGRSALKTGLGYEQTLGVNPFKFGLIGSTDSHTALPTAEENNFFSKASPGEPGVGQFRYFGDIIQKYPNMTDISVKSYESAAGGLMAVWARENTREEIFAAMERREVFASTGPRIGVRVFAGFDLPTDAHLAPDWVSVGYRLGVPMGGDLTLNSATQELTPQAQSATDNNHRTVRAPRFLVSANRDPMGANLDRIQIVKGWVNSEGEQFERVYDVVWSGDRGFDEAGKLAPVGSTVTGAEYTNAIGAPMLSATWQDPDFDPSQRAFWYVRVLEIPTPTWLAYDKAHFGDLVDLPADAKLVHQERAYSSPIWYSPGG